MAREIKTVLLLVLLFSAGMALASPVDPKRPAIEATQPATTKSSLGVQQPFPEMPGWTKSGPTAKFSPDKLYEYIDGAADLYLSYNFQELLVAEYAGKSKSSVTVEVYRHKSPLDAFGIYSQEKPAKGVFLNIGAQGYIGIPVLNFVIGNAYIKLNAYGLGDQTETVLRAFAQKVQEKIGGAKSLPAQLANFPARGKLPNSERFFSNDLLGYTFLHSGFTADYQNAGKSFQLLLIEGATPQDCKRMLTQYLQTLKHPQPDLKEGRYNLPDPNHGEVALSWRGRHICGVLHLDDAGLRQKYLTRMETQLQLKK